MKRFKRSGFGVTIALVNALMGVYISVAAAVELLGLRGRTICGNYLNATYDQFGLAVFFVIMALIGWHVARRAQYGASIARCAIVGAIAAWLICRIAVSWQ